MWFRSGTERNNTLSGNNFSLLCTTVRPHKIVVVAGVLFRKRYNDSLTLAPPRERRPRPRWEQPLFFVCVEQEST